MAPLSEHEIQKLTADVQNELSNTVFACSSLSRIVGGSASFTFRGGLLLPLSLPDGRTMMTVIVKKATDFAAINSDFELDSHRSVSNDE